jgi:hypothetical protein
VHDHHDSEDDVSDDRDRAAAGALAHGDQVLAAMRDRSLFLAALPNLYVASLLDFAIIGVAYVIEVSSEIDEAPSSRLAARALLRRDGHVECQDRGCALLALRQILTKPAR